MGVPRMVRVNELLKREIAEDIQRHFHGSDIDTAALTVTRVECSPDLRDANVYVSIFGHEDEHAQFIQLLNRKRQEITRMVIKKVKLKYTPRLQFHLDGSLAQGDHILKLLHELETDEAAEDHTDS
jgi:ribosome-binding factor A